MFPERKTEWDMVFLSICIIAGLAVILLALITGWG